MNTISLFSSFVLARTVVRKVQDPKEQAVRVKIEECIVVINANVVRMLLYARIMKDVAYSRMINRKKVHQLNWHQSCQTW